MNFWGKYVSTVIVLFFLLFPGAEGAGAAKIKLSGGQITISGDITAGDGENFKNLIVNDPVDVYRELLTGADQIARSNRL